MIRNFMSSNNVQICLGKNEKGNEMLCKNSEQDHYWLHLQSDSSPHAIVYNHIEDKVSLQEAAKLVKMFSKLKDKRNVKVIYCQLNNIKLTKNAGKVILLNNPNTLVV